MLTANDVSKLYSQNYLADFDERYRSWITDYVTKNHMVWAI